MSSKCGGCAKFISPKEAARCSKCRVFYHRACSGLPSAGEVASGWQCPECRKDVARDNKDDTPAKKTAQNPPPPHVADPSDEEFPKDVGQGLKFLAQQLLAIHQDIQDARKDIAQVKECCSSCGSRVDALEARMDELERRANEQPKNPPAVDEVVAQLRRELNDRDQELMGSDLVVANLPETNGENPTHLVKLIGSKLGVSLEDRDVVYAERVGGRHISATKPQSSVQSRPRVVTVRLARRDLRDALLNSARVRRGATTEDLGLPGPAKRFYVNERLTKQNNHLFRKVRAAAGQHGWRFVWTNRGRILARNKPGDPAHRFTSEEDIVRHIGPYTDTV